MASASEPRRGEVWLAALGAARPGEPGKNRPVIVVSADQITPPTPHALIVVVPLSSSRFPSQLRPAVGDVEGVDRPTEAGRHLPPARIPVSASAIPRAIRGVARTRLLRRLGALEPVTLAEVERALALTLGLP
jgi:mRNA interferase MazF